MRIFAEIDADQVFRAQLDRAKSEVEALDETLLSQVEDESYALRILSQVRIDPLHLRFDDAYISTHERMIPAEHHPSHHFAVHAGESYPRQTIKHHLPFVGDPDLLRCIPNPRIMWSIGVDVSDNEITFNIVNWYDNPEDVKREVDQIFGTLRNQYKHLSKQVEAFNTSAQAEIVRMLSCRREKLKKASDFVEALGLPVKQPQKSKMSVISRSQRPTVRNATTASNRRSTKHGTSLYLMQVKIKKHLYVTSQTNYRSWG